jgi:cellulose synthase/poly-beta-1,6-N-acetylglucosamine synthase-like glycosyltransferase
VVRISPDEFTFGRSLNDGIRESSSEFIVIASAHVYPIYPDWLAALLHPLLDRHVALSYGKQRAPVSAKFSEKQIFHQWYPETGKLHQETAFCNNANAAIRRSFWEKNPYDESLTGLEDLAWAKWAREQGYEISYVAEAEVIHTHEETPRGVFNRYRREAMAYKRIYPESHFSVYDFFRLAAANITSDIWQASHEKVLWKSLFSILWFRLMQFHGTRLGHRETSLITPQLRETFYYARGRRIRAETRREVEPIHYQK